MRVPSKRIAYTSGGQGQGKENGGLKCSCNKSYRHGREKPVYNSKKPSLDTKKQSPQISSEQSIISDRRLLASRFQGTPGSSRNHSKRFSVNNEDLTSIADEKVTSFQICPICLLEKSASKPLTPSNNMQTNFNLISSE